MEPGISWSCFSDHLISQKRGADGPTTQWNRLKLSPYPWNEALQS